MNHFKLWMKQALRDLRSAKNSFDKRDYYVAAFLSHQAVEKGLKALVLKKSGELVKVHDLKFLAKRLNAPAAIIDLCEKLTTVYIETRYPTPYGKTPAEKFTKADTKQVMNMSRVIFAWIRKK